MPSLLYLTCYLAIALNAWVPNIILAVAVNYDLYMSAGDALRAVRGRWKELKKFDKSIHTKEIYVEAVKQSGFSIQHFSNLIVDSDICLAAVEKTPDAFRFVPQKHLNMRIVKAGMKGRIRPANRMLKYSRDSKEEIIRSVRLNPYMIKHIPPEELSIKLYAEAVRADIMIFEYIPESLWEEVLVELKNQHVVP